MNNREWFEYQDRMGKGFSKWASFEVGGRVATVYYPDGSPRNNKYEWDRASMPESWEPIPTEPAAVRDWKLQNTYPKVWKGNPNSTYASERGIRGLRIFLTFDDGVAMSWDDSKQNWTGSWGTNMPFYQHNADGWQQITVEEAKAIISQDGGYWPKENPAKITQELDRPIEQDRQLVAIKRENERLRNHIGKQKEQIRTCEKALTARNAKIAQLEKDVSDKSAACGPSLTDMRDKWTSLYSRPTTCSQDVHDFMDWLGTKIVPTETVAAEKDKRIAELQRQLDTEKAVVSQYIIQDRKHCEQAAKREAKIQELQKKCDGAAGDCLTLIKAIQDVTHTKKWPSIGMSFAETGANVLRDYMARVNNAAEHTAKSLSEAYSRCYALEERIMQQDTESKNRMAAQNAVISSLRSGIEAHKFFVTVLERSSGCPTNETLDRWIPHKLKSMNDALQTAKQMYDNAREDAERTGRQLTDALCDYDKACRTIAEMHAAAVGGVQGAKRGVIEDVADLRTAMLRLKDEVNLLSNIRDAQGTALRKLYKARDEAKSQIAKLTEQRDRAEHTTKNLATTMNLSRMYGIPLR